MSLQGGIAVIEAKIGKKGRTKTRDTWRARAKARRAPGMLPSDAEVKARAILIREFFGQELLSHYPELDRGIEDGVRFRPVMSVCEHMRESRGLSIKEAAAALKAPQYRLKAIEKGIMSEVEPDILLRYLEFLKITEWFELWKSANAKLARSILSARGGATAKSRKTAVCRARRTR